MLFTGLKGCFSPLISASILSDWVRNGGSIMRSEREFHHTSCFFCAGMDDPWVKGLSEKSVTVLHASWVSRCVEKQFSVPISLFVLDDYFNSNQIGRPSTSNLHHSSSWTDASSSHSASTTSEPSEPVLPLKRRFHDMNSPSQENDYSPARTRPKKRQRILHTSDVNDPDNHFAEFPTVLIRNLKPFDNSVSKNHFLPSQDPIHKRDASQHSVSSDLSCSSLPSRACLSSPSVTIQSFPRIDLRRTLSLNRDSPLKLKILTPLLIRPGRKLTTDCDDSSASAFTSFWNQIAKESIRRVSSGTNATQITPILVSALPDMATTISTTSGPATSPESSTIFFPGKLHLGKKFSAENERTQ
ncbi:hypothetical protein F5879DRAFT_939855 [Lentinula edodes]|nr:hypothetical protein F5879DRAFT_939855 [Lentinula edodes]